MTTLDDRRTSPSPAPASPDSDPGVSGPATTRLRVVLLLDVLDGKEQDFLKAYEQMRHQVHAVPGHISDQLCQSLGNSSQWLITSEWESSDPFLEWVDSAEHRKMVEPMHPCVRDTTSLRFVIARETPDPAEAASRRAGRAAAPSSGLDPLPKPPLCAGGVVRHAITFTVKPGSEQAVAKLLADYESPQAQVDDTTRLLRTSLYMHGNRVVRAVEVEGDLGNALRHVAQQPEVRAVEEAINPYLEEDRDLTDPSSARSFFARAALPAVRHVASGRQPEAAERLTRLAYVHAVGPAEGPAEARRLGELDAADCADPKRPVAAATVFQRGEVLVRVLDVRTSADAAELARGGRSLDLVTDRTAPGA